MEQRKALLEFSIIPIGSGEHLSEQVARCTRLIRESGVKNELHAMGTILEGDLDDSLHLVKRCLDEVLKDSPRATVNVRIDARSSGRGGIEQSVKSVEEKV